MLGKLKIKNKIIIFFIVIYTIYTSIILSYTYKNNKIILEDAMKNRINQVYYQLSSMLSEDIRTNNTYEIHQKIQNLSSNKEVSYIIIYDNEKNVLGKTLKELPKKLSEVKVENDKFKIYRSNNGEIMDFTSGIDEVNIGYIRIGFYTKEIYNLTYLEFIKIIALNIIVFVFLLIIAYRISKMIERPVEDLTKVTNEIINKGDYKNKVNKYSYSKDFYELVDSINEMVESNRSNKKINNHLLNKVFKVQEKERAMLSRELHDEVSQSLASLLFLLSNLIEKEKDETKKERLNLIKNEIEQSLTNIRNIAVNLRPASLEEHGLKETILKYIEDYKELYNLDVAFDTNYIDLKNSNFDITIYRIIQETLTNIRKHSQATKVDIKFYINSDYISLAISDNGVGLTLDRVEKARKEGRLGIYGIRERVLDFDGQFELANNLEYTTILKCKFRRNMVEGKTDENITYR
ncbi:histidine kinase [Gemella bergeri ATCC 700627]|uniref:histidine kinase n=2 Tax=Gemella bergeri TaxID=84136 RepID=U2QB02_9BACL|nr:histidine kinase [Gemella bergeri ATCC 700627]